MQVLHENFAKGWMSTKTSSVACRRVVRGKGVLKDVQSFGSTTRELLRLSAWLEESGTTHVVMESTGVFWKPVWQRPGGPLRAHPGQPEACQERAGPQVGREGRGVAGRSCSLTGWSRRASCRRWRSSYAS